MFSPRTTFAIFKRELTSYFDSPVAYVFLVVFLLKIGSLTFWWTKFYERQVADLEPFFFWMPIVFLMLVPAATMGLWAEERRSGTVELILTMPVTMTEAIVGKFLAAWAFMTIAILLTSPMIFTVHYLGNPDNGPIFCGYLGSILMAGSYVSIGMLTSSFTRSQVVSFVISFVICLLLLLIGTPIITDNLVRLMPGSDWLIYGVASLSFWTHFDAIKRGIVDMRDILYFASLIFFMVAATHVVLDSRKSA